MRQRIELLEQLSGVEPAAWNALVRDGSPFLEWDWLASLDAQWLSTTLVVDPRRDRENRGMAWLRARSAGFKDHRIFLCGGPPFVYAAADALEAGGVPRSHMAADAFSYAPRPDGAG